MSRTRWAVPVCLVGLVFAVYYPALRAGLVNWDDQLTIGKLPAYCAAPIEYVRRVLAGQMGGKAYYPVFHLSLAMDYWVWGLRPWAFHLHNVLLHAANTLLVFWLLRKVAWNGETVTTASATSMAALAAALFAVHPANVESVAWASGRKMVLALFLALLSLHAHTRSEAGARWRLLSAAAFALACLSNATVTSLPLLAAGYDLWLRRLSAGRALLRSAPLFAVAAASGVFRSIAAVNQAYGEPFELGDIVVSRLAGLWHETLSLVWPAGLANLYAVPEPAELRIPVALTSGLALGSLALLLRNRPARHAPFSVAWYWIGMLPTLIHHFWRADRHLYFAGIGAFSLVAACAIRWLTWADAKRRAWAAAFPLLAVVVSVTTLGLLSRRQCRFWLNGVTLWSRAAALNPEDWRTHCSLGEALFSIGELPEAEARLTRALSLQPRNCPQARFGLGLLKEARGDYAGALAQYRVAVAESPSFYEALHHWGLALEAQGKTAEAIGRYREALRLLPDYAECRGNLALALEKQGDRAGALQELTQVARLQPGDAQTQLNLGKLLADRGDAVSAETHYRAAIRLDPNLAQAHYNLGCLLSSQSRPVEAAVSFRTAISLNPEYVEALTNLAVVEMQLGRPAEATKRLRRAVRIAPGNAQIQMALGVALSESGETESALRHYRQYVETRPADTEARLALAEELMRAARHHEALSCLRDGLAACPDPAPLYRPLAWLLATCPDAALRDGREALDFALRARETEGDTPETLDVFASACAAVGRFTDAVRAAARATDLALARGRGELVEELQARAELYRAGKPYRLPGPAQRAE